MSNFSDDREDHFDNIMDEAEELDFYDLKCSACVSVVAELAPRSAGAGLKRADIKHWSTAPVPPNPRPRGLASLINRLTAGRGTTARRRSATSRPRSRA